MTSYGGGYKRSANYVGRLINADSILGCLAALGIPLEDRGRYADSSILEDEAMKYDSMAKRARDISAYFFANLQKKHNVYWHGFAPETLETLVELVRYRGLFDDEGLLKEEE